MPIFNSTAHFLADMEEGGPDKLSAEDVLTQRKRPDPFYNREIPAGSLVAVHSTVSLYTPKGQKVKAVSYNLLAVQIIALPNDIE